MSTAFPPRSRVSALCPMHNVRFELKNPHKVSCEAEAHDLGHDYPLSKEKWEFCPKCQTVWPYQGLTGVTRCLFCDGETSQRRLCTSCSVMTFTAKDGQLPIVCPACFTSDGHSQEHLCEEAGRFLTGRDICPFCEEPIVTSTPESPPLLDTRHTQQSPPPTTKAPIASSVTVTIVKPDETPRSVPRTAPAEAWPATGQRLKLITVTVGVLGMLLYLVLKPATFANKIDRALAEKQYFSPPGESLYDLYTEQARKDPSSEEVRTAAVKIRTALERPAREDLDLFYRDSVTKIGWADLERYFAFLEIVAPDVPDFPIRHAYAEGQRKLTKDQDHRGALDAYSRALKLDPRFALALNGVAKVYIQDTSPMHDEQMAIYYYERAAEADPNFTWPLKNLGEIYMRRSDWQAAYGYMTRALRTSPERPSILMSMGRISYNLGRVRDAQNYYERARARSTDAQELSKINSSLAQIRTKLNG